MPKGYPIPGQVLKDYRRVYHKAASEGEKERIKRLRTMFEKDPKGFIASLEKMEGEYRKRLAAWAESERKQMPVAGGSLPAAGAGIPHPVADGGSERALDAITRLLAEFDRERGRAEAV